MFSSYLIFTSLSPLSLLFSYAPGISFSLFIINLFILMLCLQNFLIGMDMRTYENRRMTGEYDISDSISIDEIAFDDEYFEVTI